MAGMRLERFDPAADDGRREACRQVYEASRALDDPAALPMTPVRYRALLSAGRACDQQEAWLAADDGGPAGYYVLEMSGTENLSLAGLWLYVTPERRGHGTGTVLLAHAAGRARDAGRSALRGNALAGSPGDAFARAAGATPGQVEVRRGMTLGSETSALLARLREQAELPAAGYMLERWAGPTPEADLEQMAALYDAMGDAPHDASVEPSRHDGARVRHEEESFIAAGAELYQVVARHDGSGQLAAMTGVWSYPDQPELAHQGDTVVAREHRGRRLGMLVKTAMYQWVTAARPATREIHTFNADTNQYMGAINEQLGFRVLSRLRNWELDVAAAPGQAGDR
jgi:GNAT superfamily N-acetyltransferase